MIFSKRIRLDYLVTLVILGVILKFYAYFLGWVETRAGAVLNDPILAMLPAYDLNGLLFAMIYGSLILSVFYLWKHADLLLVGIQAYGIMVMFRMILMAVVPLDPPLGMISLTDPIADFLSSNTVILTRDLFFSGHTATLTLFTLATQNRKVKAILLTCTVVTAISLLIQHVHYTADVLVAPFVAYASFKLALKMTQLITGQPAYKSDSHPQAGL